MESLRDLDETFFHLFEEWKNESDTEFEFNTKKVKEGSLLVHAKLNYKQLLNHYNKIGVTKAEIKVKSLIKDVLKIAAPYLKDFETLKKGTFLRSNTISNDYFKYVPEEPDFLEIRYKINSKDL